MSHKTIAIVGVSEAEAAHLRLLMRKAAALFDHHWEWGEEGTADLLVLDIRSFAGQMARTRAQGAGMRYAIFADAPVADADLVLPRPLTVASVIEVFNQAGNATVPAPMIGANTDDFYTRDLGDEAATPNQASVLATPAPSLDEMLRAEPVELRGEHELPPPLHLAPLVDAADETIYRERLRDAPPASHVPTDASLRKYPTREAMLLDTAPHELRDYLDESLLRMPASFTLPGEPPLTLDPKNQVAYSTGGLAAVERYCHARWRNCDWQGLTTNELADIRQTQAALPYQRLRWLDVLLHSSGALASHLDPGGTYRLTEWSADEQDPAPRSRIAAALRQPARLHEAAAAAGVPMADVFDFVNASDAVGLIEWQPRPPRAREVEQAPSLMQRLRKPFARS